MKVLSFLAFTLLFLSCNDNGSSADVVAESTASFVASEDQATSDYTPLYIHDIPAPDQLNAASTPYGAYGQIIYPQMTRTEPIILVKNLWIFEYYVDNLASAGQRRAGTGQWLQFRTDGTFIGGHWDRQTHAGAWYMDYQNKYPRLTVDSNVDQLDAIWEIQGVSGDQTAMSWRRVPDAGFGPKRKSILCKMMEGYDRPTKEQFADFFNSPLPTK